MSYSMQLDMTQAVAGLSDLEKTQLPFAVAKVLTQCAQAGQTAVRNTVLPGATSPMQIRNAWTSQNIKVVPATKTGVLLGAQITADTSSGKAPDYLALQDTGGEKVPHNGHQHIAVPSDKLIQMVGKGSIIPDELRAKNLLGAVGGRFEKRRRSGRMKGQIMLTNQKRVRGFEFFLQKLGGVDAIMGRYFTDRTAYVFYWLVPEARLRAIFPFEKVCETAVLSNWEAIWQRVWSAIRVKGIRLG